LRRSCILRTIISSAKFRKMTNEQLIQKFNPLNAANLTPEDLEVMHGLTDQQIDVLANAYPNQPQRRSYIRYYDKNIPAAKQVFNLGTWQNLRNLRKFNNMKNLIPWDFFSPAGVARQPIKATAPAPGAKSPKKVVVDMTAKEAAAELGKNVDNPVKVVPLDGEKKVAKPAKAATGAKKGANKSASTPAAPVVDNPGATPSATGKTADTEFSDGQGQ
jgi:hypothetical protein